MTATNAAGRQGVSANRRRRLSRWAAKAANATRRAKRPVDAVPEPPAAPAPADDEGRLGDSEGPPASAESGASSSGDAFSEAGPAPEAAENGQELAGKASVAKEPGSSNGEEAGDPSPREGSPKLTPLDGAEGAGVAYDTASS